MIGLSRFLAKLIAGIISIYDASNLRNRVYSIQNEHELMWTALDDIARMYKDIEAFMNWVYKQYGYVYPRGTNEDRI